ncbi:MAG: LysE family translocator [Pseudomonadota bacterium]
MDTITPFLAYAGALAIAAVIPGPGVAALVGQALGGDLRRSFAFLLGLALGDVTYLTFAVLGLALIAQVFSGAFFVIKIAGGLYLLYLAWKFWTADVGPTAYEATGARSSWSAGALGYVITMGNPKTVVFYLALLPTVLDLRTVGPASWAVMAGLTFLVLFATLTPYILLAARARGLFRAPTALRRLNRGAACAIGGAGTLILGEAGASLRR